jgi:hypothetical protein
VVTLPVQSRAELEARYGRLLIGPDPAGGSRILQPIGWETKWMVPLHGLPGLPDRRLYVNRDMRDPLVRGLEAWQRQCPEYAIRKIGCWALRNNKNNPKALSLHAYALAVDINDDTNPNGDELVTDMPPLFVDCFVREGFTWGGSFKHKKDAMHFQYAGDF